MQMMELFNVSPNTPIVGPGDFNDDGKTDILFRNTTTGNAVIGLNVAVQGVADYTGDGKADILWRNTTTGNIVISRMEGHLVADWVALGVMPLTVQLQST